jgi:short-subunit dehydrogenase
MERRKLALVTGASSGIGLALANECARNGLDVVLLARGKGKLDEVAAQLEREHLIRTHVLTADLAQPNAAEGLVKVLEQRALNVDVLINNAGYAVYGEFAGTNLGDELAMIQLNIVALTQLSKLLLIRMIARKEGHILNVASTAAFQPGPLMAVYYATKAYVLSFSEALANELSDTGVTVTALCPGPTRTGFQARAQMEESKLVRGKEIMTPERVARAGFAAMMKGKTVVIPGAGNKLLAKAVRFLPRNTVTRMVRSAQERAPQQS